MSGTPTEEIIKFAIEKEIEAAAFYENLAGKVKNPVMKDAVLSMADEERKHQRILSNLTPKQVSSFTEPDIADFKISDYMVEPPVTEDIKYPDLLVLAMKREEKAHDMYAELEKRAADDATRKVFALLKTEELKHKRKLESEYEDRVLEGY
ncbi:MAG: ferritin family protein [bacterium]|jgi:rubrerythrin